jgi:hypothetical protein
VYPADESIESIGQTNPSPALHKEFITSIDFETCPYFIGTPIKYL